MPGQMQRRAAARGPAPRPAGLPWRGTAAPSAGRRLRPPRRRGSSCRPCRSGRSHHPGARQHEERLVVAGAERRRAAPPSAPGRHRQPATASMPSTVSSATAGRSAAAASRSSRNAWKLRQPPPGAARTRPPSRGRRRWRAARACRAAITAAAQIDPRRPTAPSLSPARRQCRRPGRAVEALLDPAGDDADHAGMPVRSAASRITGCPAATCASACAIASSSIAASTCLALPVHLVQRRAPAPRRLDRVVGQQQPQPQIGLGDPAGGVDARPQREAAASWRSAPSLQLGHVQQRGDARPRPPRHHPQPLRHQRAVQPGQRHHVADRRQRHQIEQRAAGPAPPGRRKSPARRSARSSRDAVRKATAVAQSMVRPELQSSRFGLTVARHRRRRPLGLVVVEHHARRRRRAAARQAVAAPPCRNRRRRSAWRPAPARPRSAGSVRAVALGQPVRHVRQHAAAEVAQQRDHQRRRCRRRPRRSRRTRRPSRRRAPRRPAARRRRPCRPGTTGRAAARAASARENRPRASSPTPRAASSRPRISGTPSRCAMPRPSRSSRLRARPSAGRVRLRATPEARAPDRHACTRQFGVQVLVAKLWCASM